MFVHARRISDANALLLVNQRVINQCPCIHLNSLIPGIVSRSSLSKVVLHSILNT